MIPSITEHFPSYATLHQATISFEEMGGRTITTQIKVDGDITPDFVNDQWSLVYKGETFTLNTHTPQATKDTSSRCSLIDLTFESEPIQRLKQYFFVKLYDVAANTPVIDKFVCPLRLSCADFIVAFGEVLKFYFGSTFTIEAATGAVLPTDVRDVDIDYTYLWEALANFYNVYGMVWRFVPITGGYKIVVGDSIGSISDHIFRYGYKGALQKIERQLEDAAIYNQLFGRGGEKNLPYRYFKKQDPNNELFAGDPDACAELENMYFDRLMDSNFRYYVKGWLRNPARQATADYPVPSYTEPQEIREHWAYQKGLTDTKFDPVEYVQDLESIAEYGIRQGKLDDDDEIYPTIQGDANGMDEMVAVGEITDGDDSGAIGGVKTEELADVTTIVMNYNASSGQMTDHDYRKIVVITGPVFHIDEGFNGRVEYAPYLTADSSGQTHHAVVTVNKTTVVAVREDTQEESPAEGLLVGGQDYHLKVTLDIRIQDPERKYRNVAGIKSVVLVSVRPQNQFIDIGNSFQVWVKNIWGTTKGADESAIEYAERVWAPILGDRLGNEARVVFSDGAMAASSDWDFPIVEYAFDQSKSINGVPSEWRLTLGKSDAEMDAIGKLIPNATSAKPVAGNHFFFVGIDMPHSYVTAAERRLNDKKQEALDGKAYANPTWAIQLDPVRINTLEDGEETTLMSRLDIGKAIKIYDPRFSGGQVLTLTIRTLNIVWSEGTVMKPSVEVVLSENVLSRSSVSQTLSPTAIRARVDDAVAQAKRAVFMQAGSPPYVNKSSEEQIYGQKDFKAGATFGSYVPGLVGSGATIDSLGNGEMESLTLRKFLEVPEFRYNRVEVQAGNYWRAPGGGIIDRVERDYDGDTPLGTGTIFLKLEEGEIASVVVDDICMGIFHKTTGNAQADADDSMGNFSFAGFSTCYFRITDILASDGSIFKYELRPTDSNWQEYNHPQAAMTFVAYGNFTDTTRQTSRYSTRTYERYLKGINTWEIAKDNIAAQFGDLSNLTVLGITGMSGYSAYLENIYMTGYLTVYNALNAIIARMGDMSNYVVDGASKKYPFWIGGETPDAAAFRIREDGELYASKGIFSGFIRIPYKQLSTCNVVDNHYSPGKDAYIVSDHTNQYVDGNGYAKVLLPIPNSSRNGFTYDIVIYKTTPLSYNAEIALEVTDGSNILNFATLIVQTGASTKWHLGIGRYTITCIPLAGTYSWVITTGTNHEPLD